MKSKCTDLNLQFLSNFTLTDSKSIILFFVNFTMGHLLNPKRVIGLPKSGNFLTFLDLKILNKLTLLRNLFLVKDENQKF